MATKNKKSETPAANKQVAKNLEALKVKYDIKATDEQILEVAKLINDLKVATEFEKYRIQLRANRTLTPPKHMQGEKLKK